MLVYVTKNKLYFWMFWLLVCYGLRSQQQGTAVRYIVYSDFRAFHTKKNKNSGPSECILYIVHFDSKQSDRNILVLQ